MRPTNLPPGEKLSDYEDSEQKLPKDRPICGECKERGDDNWWHLWWDSEKTFAMRSLLGSACQHCMLAKAKVWNAGPVSDELPPEIEEGR